MNYRVKRKRHHLPGHHHRHHHHHHRRRRLQNAAILILVFVLLIGGLFGTWQYLRSSGRTSLLQSSLTSTPDMGELQDESGVVSYNGKKYRYNENMINILCMGIDQSTEESADEAVGEHGQADTIFLVSLNSEEQTLKLIGISRDTMTAVRTYDRQGNFVGETTNHLGLAYAFGDGGAESGKLMTEAVSNLMYDLPIHGYAAIRLDAISKLNDAVGGVLVTLPEDLILNGEEFKKGDTVRLRGNQAQSFVRSRHQDQQGSNLLRMERQKLYATSFISEASNALKRNPTLAADLYRGLTKDMVTSIGIDEAVYLASLVPSLHFGAEDIFSLDGEIRQGGVYEEFYIDEEALLDTIFDTFYIEVS